MRTEIKLPELGENIESGDLLKVLVTVGQRVEKDQPIVELETDKATIEVPSSAAGVVLEIPVKEGQKVKVGQILIVVEEAGAPASQAATAASAPALKKTAAEEAAAALKPAAPATAPPAPAVTETARARPFAPAPPRVGAGGRSPADVPASPAVRQLAREIGVDITEVEGTGPGGRISFDDVKRQARERPAGLGPAPLRGAPAAAVALPDFSKWGPVERQGFSAVRRATARHLTAAWTIPHVTQNDKADITALEELRRRYAPKAEAAGGKLTMTAIALKVVAGALKAFPKFAASIDMAREEIIFKKYIHIGVAVDTDRGLIVPVIRDVDKKNVVQLSVELSQAAEKARARKVAPTDLEGGVFSITNLGGIGGTFFSPIINAPEAAVLGMARAEQEPVYVNGQFQPRLMLPLSLSYDHRIIDGAEAARFLRWLCEAFEQPFLLALEG